MMNSKLILILLIIFSIMNTAKAHTHGVVANWFQHFSRPTVCTGLAVGTVILAISVLWITINCLKQSNKDGQLPLYVVPDPKHVQHKKLKRIFIPDVDENGFVSINLQEDKYDEYSKGEYEAEQSIVMIKGNEDHNVFIWS